MIRTYDKKVLRLLYLIRRWDTTSFINSSVLPDDSHLVAFNPQFHLSISAHRPVTGGLKTRTGIYGTKDSSSTEHELLEVWVLLSRHVRERKRDLSQKYLAVHVHTGGLFWDYI